MSICYVTHDELTMINSGEANMEMSETTLKYPTNICLSSASNSLMLTNTMSAKRAKTASSSPVILSCKSKG